jgi:hypothetical protein
MRYEAIIEVLPTSTFMSYCTIWIWIAACPSRQEYRTVTLLCATSYLIEPFLEGDARFAWVSLSPVTRLDGGQELALVTRSFID